MTKTLYQRYRYNGKFPFMMFNSNKVAQAMFDGTAAEEIIEPSPEIDYSKEYFTVTSWEDNNTLYLLHSNSSKNMQISFDKTTWAEVINGQTGTYTYTLNKGEKAYFKGVNNSMTNVQDRQTCWSGSKTYEFSGNIMSLLWGDDFIGKTVVPSTSTTNIFGWAFIPASSTYANVLTMRNLVIPMTTYPAGIFKFTFAYLPKLLYLPKEFPAQTYVGNNAFEGAFEYSSKIKETPIFRLTTAQNYYFNGMTLDRFIALCNSSYPSNSATIKYKLSTNASVSGSAYRDFDTLEAQDAFLSIWAETETPYDGIVAGCSDYFIAGDTVTLEYVAVNGTFNGYYDENDNLLSSSSTYTFTAQRSMKIKVKTT